MAADRIDLRSPEPIRGTVGFRFDLRSLLSPISMSHSEITLRRRVNGVWQDIGQWASGWVPTESAHRDGTQQTEDIEMGLSRERRSRWEPTAQRIGSGLSSKSIRSAVTEFVTDLGHRWGAMLWTIGNGRGTREVLG